jgi:hypothetical protein
MLLLCVCLAADIVADHAASKLEAFESSTAMSEYIIPAFPSMCPKVTCVKEAPVGLDYWYRGYCKDKFSDFAALAVFENQSCPQAQNNGGDSLCVSRYRIIRVLDAASDTLKKKYINVKEWQLLPQFRYRPLLIFGNYRNGDINIKGYEDVREYFFPLTQKGEYGPFRWMMYDPDGIGQNNIKRVTDIQYSRFTQYDIYSLYSIGTPYYNANTLDSMERMYYNEYLIPEIKLELKRVGKDFNKLWRRLTQNRTTVKTTPIKNDFAALGMIKNMRVAKDSKQNKLCVLDIGMETIIKNKTNIDSSVTICKYGDCPSLTSMIKPLYLLGDFKNYRMVIDSLISTDDAFIFGDTIYDISMGFPFDEFLSYFLPSNLSVDDYTLYYYFSDSEFMTVSMTPEIISVMESQPEQRKRIEAAILNGGLAYQSASVGLREPKVHPDDKKLEQLFGYWTVIRKFKKYRCREYR